MNIRLLKIGGGYEKSVSIILLFIGAIDDFVFRKLFLFLFLNFLETILFLLLLFV